MCDNLHMSYTEALDISIHERKSLIKLINRKQDLTSEFIDKMKEEHK